MHVSSLTAGMASRRALAGPLYRGLCTAALLLHACMDPRRKFIWVPGFGRLKGEDGPPTLGDGKQHGAYYWDQDAALL